MLRQFAEFLARQQRPPRDLDELTPPLVRQWRESLPAGAGGYTAFGGASAACCATTPGCRPGRSPTSWPAAASGPRARSSPTARRSSTRSRRRPAARFRAALQRISDNALHLQRWRDGAFAEGTGTGPSAKGWTSWPAPGTCPGTPARTGTPSRRSTVSAFGGQSGAATWQRLFLTREEATALGVLLLAEFGWNLSVIATLEVPRAEPDQGEDGRPTYRVPLEKPRRGPGRHHETRNVTDDGAGSPGRLITQALQATRFARAIVEELAPGTDRLIAWRTARPGRRGRTWTAAAGRPVLLRRPQQQRGRLGEGRRA